MAKHNKTVLVVHPNEAPKAVTMDISLETLQRAVDGYIEAIYPYDDPVALICNEEGKLNGLPLNRYLRDEDGDVYDAVAGTFLIVGLTEEDFTGLTPELLVKYAVLFAKPDVINPTNPKPKSEWFGQVRWCDDDIKAALLDDGFKPTKEAIEIIRAKAEHRCFTEGMICTGWDYLHAYIFEENKRLTPVDYE